MIHVCFGLHDKTGRYSKFTGTTILSIFENTVSDVTVHILHDNTLSTDNRDKFIYLAGRYGQTVKFYNVEDLCADKIKEMIELVPSIKNSRVSVGAFYRLVVYQMLPTEIEKIIYLDSDIIVNLNVNELWQIEPNNRILGAVPVHYNGAGAQKIFYVCENGFVKYKNYFNSGVLVIDLKYLREKQEKILSGVKFRGNNPQCDYFDQDILNYCFSAQALKLPVKFNRYVKSARPENEMTIGKKIYHFAGSVLGMDMNDPFNRLWMDYFIKTPWFDTQTIGNLYDRFRQMNVTFKQSMINFSTFVSGKTRAFFIMPQNADALKKIFSIRDDEEIFLAENNESLKKLFDAMNTSRGKKIFFIIVPNFPFGILKQAGFVYGRDFVDGKEFLSESHGVPLDSNPLIQAL